MKLNKVDILILITPVIIMLLIAPVLPERVPIHWNFRGVANGFIDRKFSFIIGIIPFVLYEYYKSKRRSK